jgi:hypothetical protein
MIKMNSEASEAREKDMEEKRLEEFLFADLAQDDIELGKELEEEDQESVL